MRQYVVIYEQAGDNYSAYVPDLPGCVACGDTIEETEALMKAAIEIYLAETRREGLPVPEPTTRAGLLAVAG
jgi:predicted RNase H-like HicB family nuclease